MKWEQISSAMPEVRGPGEMAFSYLRQGRFRLDIRKQLFMLG